MRAKRFFAVFFLLLVGIPAAAQTADELFDLNALQEIRLTVNPADWDQFKANFMQNDYYPADVAWGGIAVKNIGIRHRGTSSRSGTKPYIGLKFDQYVKGQQFLGLSSLRLKNAINDPSFLHEILGMLLFRRMGLPAPREAYARLYVNDEYSGLYWMVEEVDNAFLDRVFGERTGCLYSYNWVGEYHFEYLGDDPSLYAPDRFEPKSCPSSTDPAFLIEMIRTINLSSDDEFISRTSEFLDLKRFLRFLAVDQFLGNWDGVLGWAGMNNFYLYRFAGTKRFQFTAWDKDNTFENPQHSLWYQTDENVLTRRLLQYPEFYAAYQEALRRTALEAGGVGGWLEQELMRAYAQIRFAALEDPFKTADNAAFENGVREAREFVRARKEYVISQVGPSSPPFISSGGVVNGASYTQSLTPGSIGTIFGANLGFTDMGANAVPLPTLLDKTAVQVNGIAVPLFFVSPAQINFQVPWELAGQSQASLLVTVDGMVSDPQPVSLTPMAPAVFSMTSGGQGAILIASTGELAAPLGSVKGHATRPVRRGEFISIYSTGLGPVTNQPATGGKPSGEARSLMTATPVVTIGGVPAPLTFSGLAPDFIGLYQLNAQVPEGTPSGDAVPVKVTIGAVGSNTVTIAIE
ncbi:MAG: hypothetical protein A3H28_02510 [Acidobacteria bacterium RIFCSPLOWO2_02_FULL_61_28]|nr:MAG: hypothetical protein A3H28_02510 [Acidobacteria bacterium RIFCSPLOWO2_02_FULL_61_28]